jgi:hypothetical protein
MQTRYNHASPTTERQRFLRGPCNVVKKKSSVEKSRSSFEMPACQDMSLVAQELN